MCRLQKILLMFVLIAYGSISGFAQSEYNMNNSNVTACEGYFYDSGGSGTSNFGLILGCVTQNTYENNEQFTKTFCASDNTLNLRFIFDVLDLQGTDYLKVYDGPTTGSPLIANLTSASSSAEIISTGDCLTFEFRSYNNGTTWYGCDDGGNWAAYFTCVEIFMMDDPTTAITCNGVFVDDGGLNGDYSESATPWTKTFCSDIGWCVKLNFSELNLQPGDVLNFYNGQSASGTPIYSLTGGSPIPQYGISSEEGECLTVKFTPNNDGSVNSGWIATLYCPPECGTPPECTDNPDADNQCVTATPICNLNGFCGNTSSAYTSLDPGGTDWDAVEGLSFCGSIENNSWLSFVAEAEVATLNVWTFNCTDNSGIQMEIYETSDCQTFVSHSNCQSLGSPSDFTMEAYDLIPGNTYYLMIDGFAGDVCDYIISAGSGVEVGAEITDEQTVCFGKPATITVYGTDTVNTTYTWSAVPPDPTLAGQENNYSITVYPTDTTTYYCAISGPPANSLCDSINTTIETMVNILDALSTYCVPNVTCEIDVVNNDTAICNGSYISLSATGSVYETVLANDFNDGTAGINWASTTSANFTNPCGPGPDNTYLWMGSVSPAVRQLTSADFDVSSGGTIGFYLRFEEQSGVSGTTCEGPDLEGEGVSLQYSTDQGFTWSDITYFSPSGNLLPTNPNPTSLTQVTAGGATNFTTWKYYTFPIPAGAQSAFTRFRWVQLSSTTLENDHWGLDSISIIVPPADAELTWTSVPAGYNGTGTNPPAVNPSDTTWYYVTASATIDGDVYSCTDSVRVDVFEPISAFSVNDTIQCLSNNSFVFSNEGTTGAGYEFEWSFGDGTANSTDENPIHSYVNSGVYFVTQTISYAGACTQSSSMTVTVIEPLQLSFTEVTESCFNSCDGGFNLAVVPAGTYTYSWSDGSSSQNLDSVCSGTYSVSVTDTYQCVTSLTDVLDPRDELVVDSIITVSPTCSYDMNGTAVIYVSGGTGINTYTFQWDENAYNSTAQMVPGLSYGVYGVTVRDANLCEIDTMAYVDTITPVTVQGLGSKTICYGKTTLISCIPDVASGNGGPFNYYWMIPPSTLISTDQELNVTPDVTTNYYIYAEDILGCKSSFDTVTITVMPPLTLDLSCDDPYLCEGDTAFVRLSYSGGTGGPYMVYLNNETGSTLVTPPLYFVPEQSEGYSVTVKDDCSIPATDSLDITVHPPVPIQVIASRYSGCQPVTVLFSDIASNIGQTYLWDFGDDSETNISIMNRPEHTYEDHGVFDLTVQVRSDSGCIETHVYEDLVTVYRTPNAKFWVQDDDATAVWPVVHFHNQSDITDICTWNFDDGSPGSSEVNPSHTYPSVPEDYMAELIVSTIYNCADTAYAPVEIKDNITFYAPSAIVPEGTIDENRIFKVFGNGIQKNHFHMIIYDRWGEVVFETYNYEHGWDGTIKGKKVASNGVYTWMVKYYDIEGTYHTELGSVTVIR